MGAAKLTPKQVADIRDRVNSGETRRDVAKAYGVSAEHVGLIDKGLRRRVDHATGCVECGRKQFSYSYWRADGAELCNLCGRDMAAADRGME